MASQTVAPSAAWNSADCDNDGLTNSEETTGVNDPSTPGTPTTTTNPLDPDSDDDGVTDGNEAIDGTNPLDPCSFVLASQTLTPGAELGQMATVMVTV
ncbi:MAG: hypothetical protein R2779_06770 [Crocinitomicaceae bacterium]